MFIELRTRIERNKERREPLPTPLFLQNHKNLLINQVTICHVLTLGCKILGA